MSRSHGTRHRPRSGAPESLQVQTAATLDVAGPHRVAKGRNTHGAFIPSQHKPASSPRTTPGTSTGTAAGINLKTRSDEISVLQDAHTYFKLYKEHPWLRAIVDKSAAACAADDYTVEHADGGAAGTNPEFARAIKVYVNGIFGDDPFTFGLKEIFTDLYIGGISYLRKLRSAVPIEGQMGPHGSGVLVKLQHFDAKTVVPILDANNIRTGYKVFTSGKYDDTYETIPLEEMVCIQTDKMGRLGIALSKLEALDSSLALDLAAIEVNKGFMQNGAKAGDVYAFKPEGMSPTQIERERQYIKDNYCKPGQSYEPMFLAGNIQLVHRGVDSRKDADFLKLREYIREEIASVYHYPLTLLSTSIIGALGSNGKETDLLMWNNDEVSPMQILVYSVLNQKILVEELGITDHKLVAPQLDRLRLELVQIAREMIRAGATGNQALRVMGLPDVKGLDTPLFLERASIIGIPGSPDSAVVTNSGVVSGDIKDALEMAQKGISTGTVGEGGPQGGGASSSPSGGGKPASSGSSSTPSSSANKPAVRKAYQALGLTEQQIMLVERVNDLAGLHSPEAAA